MITKIKRISVCTFAVGMLLSCTSAQKLDASRRDQNTRTAFFPNEVLPVKTKPCFEGAYYRKLVSSVDHWVGISGQVVLPQIRFDETRKNPKNEAQYLDNPSIYLGGNVDGQETDIGLSWEVIREKDGQVSKARKAFRPFLRRTGYGPDQEAVFVNAPAQEEYYWYPGEEVFMSLETVGDGLVKFVIEGAGKSYQTTFECAGYALRKKGEFKRVNAIDQMHNEGKPVQTTKTIVEGAKWLHTDLLRIVDGQILKVPFHEGRYTEMNCPELNFFAVEASAATKQRGGEVIHISGQPKDYFVDRNILWFDATANFERFCHQDSITYYLSKSLDAGITDVVVDVKPISGEVLFKSKIAPMMLSWENDGKLVEKDTSWDMLTHFIEEGQRLGLRVHASTNIFVAGHNHFDRGVVYEDTTKKDWQTISYLPEGMVPITARKNKYSAMLNPARRDVQAYQIAILKELATNYPTLNGIILDRVRFDGIESDFSDTSRVLFEAYLGEKIDNFPADIFSYAADDKNTRIEGSRYKEWLTWRTKIIHDFIVEAKKELKSINKDLIFGDYTGSWYPVYYEVGVNFASNTYDPSKDYDWASEIYQNYGYAEELDLFTTGNYYFEVNKEEAKAKEDADQQLESGATVKKEAYYTVEGSAELVNKVTKGVVPVYAGLFVEQYKDHPEQFVKALKMCREKSHGSMVFDIVHIINYGWWDELKEGLSKL